MASLLLLLALGILFVGVFVFLLKRRPISGASVGTGRLDIVGRRGFWLDVVGESSYQGTLRQIDRGRLAENEDVTVSCLVVPEPDNQYDRNALAVVAEGYGKVGYFQRDEASGRYLPLGNRLRSADAVGVCEGRLIGGWDEDISIGVRLSILTPSELGGASDHTAEAPTPRDAESLKCSVPDWSSRPRVELAPGKRYLNLVDEYLCQVELKRLAGDRDPVAETIVFPAVLVPDGDAIIVCAEGGQPVGRFGSGDVTRFVVLRDHLVKAASVGGCEAWLIAERGGLGVKISLKGPKTIERELTAT